VLLDCFLIISVKDTLEFPVTISQRGRT